MNSEKNCYLIINGKRVGPLSEQDVKNLYLQKKIDKNTKFARAGAKEWISLSMSDIIAPADAGDGLPPLPPEAKAPTGLFKGLMLFFKCFFGFLLVILLLTVIIVMVFDTKDDDPTSSAAANNPTSDGIIQTDPSDEDGKQNIDASEENGSLLWTVNKTVNEKGEPGEGIYVQGVFDAALWENVNYDLHLSESFEKVAEETFLINIYDTKGFDEMERIADIGVIEIRPIGFDFQGPGPALEHDYPMTVTVEGETSEFELHGSFASTYVLVSDEETFVNNLYEGKTMSIEIPFSRYKYSFTIDGTGFKHAYDEFRLQTGLQPYPGNSERGIDD